MGAVKGKGWSPERRAQQAQRIRDTMAANPGMSERGRQAAAAILSTQEGRAKRLASAAKARAAFKAMGDQARADAIAKAKIEAAKFWADPARVAVAQAKRQATLAKGIIYLSPLARHGTIRIDGGWRPSPLRF